MIDVFVVLLVLLLRSQRVPPLWPSSSCIGTTAPFVKERERERAIVAMQAERLQQVFVGWVENAPVIGIPWVGMQSTEYINPDGCHDSQHPSPNPSAELDTWYVRSTPYMMY